MNPITRSIISGVILLGCSVGISGCSVIRGVSTTSNTQTSKSNITAVKSQSKTQVIRNVVLANSNVPGHPGWQLKLVDVRGKYINKPSLGPFYGSNWTGDFQLRIVTRSGNVLSGLSLSNKYTQTLFMRKFQFHFADYNDDGNPDFALGQYFDSNGDTYELFTIRKNGHLSQLKIMPAQLFTVASGYSPLFQRVKPRGFQVKFYDNSKTQWFHATYLWKHREFLQSSLKVIGGN